MIDLYSKSIEYHGRPADFVTFIDITERERAEEALAKSERYLRRAELVAGFGHWEFNLDTKEAHGSDGASSLYGLSNRDWSIPEVQMVPLPEYRPILDEALRALVKDNRQYDVEFRIKRPSDGKVVDIHSIAEYDPKTRVVFGVIHDITGRRQAEEALQQANKKLNLLSSITRHDIKNQLMALNGFLELLYGKIQNPACEEYFSRIVQASSGISTMIDFTREYEKIGVAAPVWQKCRTLVDMVSKEVPLGKVVVKNDLPSGMEVFADPLINRVCYNLMDNAARYGGSITTIRFSIEERDGNSIIVCEDDGDGVPADKKEQIFDRGFGKNTGMGLYLAREILSITGITIQETGVHGKGGRFEITVPKGGYRFNKE